MASVERSPTPTLGLPALPYAGPPGVPFTSTPLPQLQLKGGDGVGTVMDGSPLIASPAVPRWTPRVLTRDLEAGPVGPEGAGWVWGWAVDGKPPLGGWG